MSKVKYIYKKVHEIADRDYIKYDAKCFPDKHIDVNTVIIDSETGDPLLGYFTLDYDKKLTWALKNIKLSSSKTNNTDIFKNRVQSITFGYSPRSVYRKSCVTCRASSINRDMPKTAEVLMRYGSTLNSMYKKHFPEVYSRHEKLVENILPEWKIADSVFSSGIVNYNNRLYYHRDAGNYKDVYSNMVVIKKDIEGGHLRVPGLDVCIPCLDGTLVYFDGQRFVHGVTPIKKKSLKSYRYSVVYYTLKHMEECLSFYDEIEHGRLDRTKREYKNKDKKYEALQSSREGRKGHSK